MKSSKSSQGSTFHRLTKVVVPIFSAVLVFLLTAAFLKIYLIPTGSMQPSIDPGDRVAVLKVTPSLLAINRGDIVVFDNPTGWEPSAEVTGAQETLVGTLARTDGMFVKRVIGLPGDYVKCCSENGEISVNGQKVREITYVKLPAGATSVSADYFEVRVPANALWVMGDNRYNSIDSRYNRDTKFGGFVPINRVQGKVIAKVWPLTHLRLF